MALDPDKRKARNKRCYSKHKEKRKAYQREWYQRNKEANNERIKLWGQKNKEARRNNLLKSQYNITLDDYNEMFNKQEGRCATCKRHQSEFNKRLHVDHCHKTGKVRGLLCSKCNSTLGFINEDPETLKNMIKYLKNECSINTYQSSREIEQVSELGLR